MPKSRCPDLQLRSDELIAESGQDVLDRGNFAESIASKILSRDIESCMVVGISGPWGSGKSSLLNLVEERIHKAAEGKPGILILRFNPWSYATIDQLIAAFFRDLRSKLRLIDRSDLVGKIRTALERVRSLLAPIVNISETWPVGMAYSVATQIWKSRQKAAIKPLVQLLNLLLHPLRHSL